LSTEAPSAGPQPARADRYSDTRSTEVYWLIGGGMIVLAAVLLAWISPRFDDAIPLSDRPVLPAALGMVMAGIAYCLALPPLIRGSLDLDHRRSRSALVIVLGTGLLARLVLFPSTPVLEDDFYRYLWDGAVTAAGGNPYAVAPADIAIGPNDRLGIVVGPDASRVLERIGHAELRSIYPPVAQAAFALAHLIEPWSLTAWRAVILLCDLATIGLLLALLDRAGRSRLWAALYWWNPVVIAALYNGAHMDIAVLPPLLLALLLATGGASVASAASLAVAAGAKVWPILLLPLVLRPLTADPRRLAVALSVFTAVILIMAAPVALAGLDETSGFTAYAQNWQRNSALYPALAWLIAPLLDGFGWSPDFAGLVARGAMAVACAAFAVVVSLRPVADAGDLMRRTGLIVAALLLLAPAQYPWYLIWLAPFLAFRPSPGLLLLAATLPVYFTAFYFLPRGQIGVFDHVVVWFIWVPVWVLLAREALDGWRRTLAR
jgi:alpha-1,6-mannosyltransferase